MNRLKGTQEAYGFLWKRDRSVSPAQRWHFNAMQDVIDEPIVRGRIGIEIGSGCGYDTYIIAKNNPSVKLVSMDISEGVSKTKELTSKLRNVWVVQGSALGIPLKGEIFDFAYSFGVLHHTENPEKGLSEAVRVLKKNSPVFLYLYEDHLENQIKYIAVKMVALMRAITVKMPLRLLYMLSWIASPFVFIIFTVPAKMLRRSKMTKHIAEKMPFNFGTTPFSLRGDLYDRFSAPVEYRFNREEICGMLNRCNFCNVRITKLKDTAGWVVWGYKK